MVSRPVTLSHFPQNLYSVFDVGSRPQDMSSVGRSIVPSKTCTLPFLSKLHLTSVSAASAMRSNTWLRFFMSSQATSQSTTSRLRQHSRHSNPCSEMAVMVESPVSNGSAAPLLTDKICHKRLLRKAPKKHSRKATLLFVLHLHSLHEPKQFME